MSERWFEVWADEGLAAPYLLLVMPDQQRPPGIIVIDPKENDRIIHSAVSYDEAKEWLLEDEYILVRGRM